MCGNEKEPEKTSLRAGENNSKPIMSERRVLVSMTGNTYPMKEKIKERGYSYHPRVGWYKISESIEEARKIMEEIKNFGFLPSFYVEGQNFPSEYKYKAEVEIDGIYFFRGVHLRRFDDVAHQIYRKLYHLKNPDVMEAKA